jgi:putative NADH-flavin reductase
MSAFCSASSCPASNDNREYHEFQERSMKVVLYGATGNAGSRILNELKARGHNVTAVARDTGKMPAGVEARQDDLSNADRIAEIIKGADAAVSAYMPPQDDTDQLLGVTKREIEAVRKAGNVRLIVVGGAASLEVAPGISLLASGHLPAAWMPIATSHEKALRLLEASDINWTYFSPAAFFEPGERTGKFRLGGRGLVSNDKGESRISMEDYAVALVDELEKPRHERAQFTIGY